VQPKQLKTLPKNERKRLRKLVELEEKARAKGYQILAGVDEVGRGPLAGPLVAAACMIQDGLFFGGINDSKQLTPLKRRHLYEQLTTHPGVSFGMGLVEHQEIDRINIHQSTLVAMRQAVAKLPQRPDYLLVDGLHLTIDGIMTERIIKGDTLSQMIAAASIIAKETRDQIMIQYHEEYPEYGFAQHKGYGTELHFQALAKYGPCPIHRKTFLSSADLPLTTLSYSRIT
jgi:ribonuclease HII